MKIQRTSVKLAEKVSRIQTECTIQKNGIFQSITGTMIISEDIFNKIPDKQYAYMHWLKNGEYVKMQQEL